MPIDSRIALALLRHVFTETEVAEASNVLAPSPWAMPRTSSASASIDRVRPYLRDYGITRVANVTHLDRVGIPIHTALKPMGRTLSNGSGKGLTPEASKISAMMEAIEQTHLEDDHFDRFEATQDDLSKQSTLFADGDLLPQMKLSLWNHRLPIYWTEMKDIVSGACVLAPTELIEAVLT